MINRRIAACTISVVVVQPEVVLRAGAVSNVVHLQRVYILVSTILPMRDAAIVAETTPAEGSRAGTSGSPKEV
jgi:hypothetical protein